MQYPLPETIGDPDLFVGREEEFEYLNEWLERIPKRLSVSTVILARRKSGKTAILERIFNTLWSHPEMEIIPFFLGMRDIQIWVQQFAINYYRTFASHCISFFERDPSLVRRLLTFNKIRSYGIDKNMPFFVDDVDEINECLDTNMPGMIWDIASSAPHRFAALHDKRVLVIIDEFQYFSSHIYFDKNCKNHHESMPGSYHALVESKIAPMLVSGSYVSWMLSLMEEYLEAGRLDQFYISPYLKPDEGLQAVYKYSEYFNKPITNRTAEQINTLCMSDPFFIYYVIKNCPKNALTTKEGVIDAVYSELTGKHSKMAKVWAEYINKTVDKINDKYAKDILLHLCKHNDRTWTPEELKQALSLKELTTKEIHQRLEQILEADLIEDGGSDIRYKGLTDGTLYLVLRHRFEEEIRSYEPDFKTDFQKQIDALEQEKRSLRGQLSHLIGKFAEYQLATDMRTRKRFSLSIYFTGISDTKILNLIDVKLHYKFQRDDGKEMEIDIKAVSECKRIVLVEVKKWKKKVGVQVIRDFIEKIEVYSRLKKKHKIIPAFLSAGGFSVQAKKMCKENKIGISDRFVFKE
jgi:hypothetical protein